MKLSPFITVSELLKLLENKEISREEVLEFFTARFAQHDKKIGSALEIFDQKSVLDASQKTGALAGVPILLKDNIAQKSRKLTCASKILEHFECPYDATVTERLKTAGSLLMGRANMDEFAMGSSNEYSAFFNCANPWDTSRVAGGSSGGPIAAVAAGLVPCALGSETGGSVRLPASWCNIVGLKPSYGLVSRYGLVAYASSLDQIGIATHTVYDNARVLSLIAGNDQRDSTSISTGPTDYTKELDGTLPKKLTIGVIENMLWAEGVRPDVQERIQTALDEFARAGAEIKKIKIPEIDYGAAVYFIISRAEAASNLSRFDGVRYGHRTKDAKTMDELYSKSRAEGFGYEQKLRTLVGNYVLSAGYADQYYHSAQKVQSMLIHAIDSAFKSVDVMLAPVHAAPAFKFGACADPLTMDLTDYFTGFVNLAHIPALSVPCGFMQENLPTAFQLIGPKMSEALLYKVAHAYEQKTPWHTMHPKEFAD